MESPKPLWLNMLYVLKVRCDEIITTANPPRQPIDIVSMPDLGGSSGMGRDEIVAPGRSCELDLGEYTRKSHPTASTTLRQLSSTRDHEKESENPSANLSTEPGQLQRGIVIR